MKIKNINTNEYIKTFKKRRLRIMKFKYEDNTFGYIAFWEKKIGRLWLSRITLTDVNPEDNIDVLIDAMKNLDRRAL